jgi:para-aminobenzoate synthetase component 1
MFENAAVFQKMNQFGQERKPFLFMIDFECVKPVMVPLAEAAAKGLFYNFRGITNEEQLIPDPFTPLEFSKIPRGFAEYLPAWETVMKGLKFGNSYLVNLTMATPIEINISLKAVFQRSTAPYRLLAGDDFVVFSPECFVRMEHDTISSFPMKGTIDAGLPEASEILMNDPKELAEHNTIVDLIRNDLSMVSSGVKVNRFRYLEHITTNQRNLLQASSEISGHLTPDWRSRLGDILATLLPAGSISGAPKRKTVEIIRAAEQDPRGFYTGVCGIFDGNKLDSAVMIRFIGKENSKFVYRSGGGITINSEARKEYQELIDKVYVPFV